MSNKWLYVLAFTAMPATAQDIYTVEKMTAQDLNGTARSVGMGGAMSALGADLSIIQSNPAGIGLFRSSDFSLSASATTQPGAEKMNGINKARPSFDQMGFVYAARIGGKHLKFFNFGFNYQKARNFKQYLGLNNISIPGALSQSYQMAMLANYYGQWEDGSGEFVSPLADAAYNSIIVDYINGSYVGAPYGAGAYSLYRVNTGGVHRYDVNFSANMDDCYYLGLTIGAVSVNQNSFLDYREALLDGNEESHISFLNSDEQLKGCGVDVTLGVIMRPLEESPFRLGFSVTTPTWLNLTGNNILSIDSPFEDGKGNANTIVGVKTGDFDYRITTPWKFNVSAGTTFGTRIAVGAEYEFKNNADASVRYPDDIYYDEWGSTYGRTYLDNALGVEMDTYLKPIHTLKIGIEARLTDGLFARAGYNFVSKPFKGNAIKNLYAGYNTDFGDSDGVINTTSTDYVNLGATNRFTLGLGYHGKHFYADVAYQYQKQNGEVTAFHEFEGDNYRTNLLPSQSVDLNRHNVLFTVGYKF